MKRTNTIAVMLILLSSIIIGQTTAVTVQKPCIPEFTVKYVDNSYDIPPTYGTDQYTGKTVVTDDGEHVDKRTLIFTIKNQPFTPYTDKSSNKTVDLLYDIRYKGSFGQEWTKIFGGDVALYAGMDNLYSETGYPAQDYNAQYTTITYTLPWDVPAEGKLDFQVKAFAGYTEWHGESHIIMAFGAYNFYGEESDWSSTKTIDLSSNEVISSQPFTPSPSSTPRQMISNNSPSTESPENPTETPIEPNTQIDITSGFTWEHIVIVVACAVIAALAVALVLARRKKP